MNASPPIKWVGSKAKSLPIILQVAPKTIDTYYEPFCGGASLFWALANEGRFNEAILSDANPELINFYEVLKTDPHYMKRFLKDMASGEKRTRAEYEKIRALDPSSLSPSERAARFLYLNKTSFNGLWRENNLGKMNVPWNQKEKVTFYEDENIEACQKALQKASIFRSDFDRWVDEAVYQNTEGTCSGQDFSYLDPPYLPISKTSDFTSYSEGGFPIEEHARVAFAFRRLAKAGVKVALSNSDCDAARILYAGYNMIKVPTRRNVGASAESRKAVDDLLILANLEPPK